MSSDTFSRMKAQPPRNLDVNSSDREMGLLRISVIEPGSNSCGMMVEVTRIAAIMPNTPTIQPTAVVSTHSLMKESTWSLLKGNGSEVNHR